MKAFTLPEDNWGEIITITGFFYRVDFGPGAKIRHHYVIGDVCSCSASERCKSVVLVQTYLKSGGEPAPNPPDGFYAVLPRQCPVCGAAVQPDPRRNSPVRGNGWQCLADKGHYWQSLGRQKKPACHCFAYPFAHQPGSGICTSGKQTEHALPHEVTALVPVPA